MRVLQLGPYPPPEGGINRNMLAIRDELRARGGECSIVATAQSTRVTNEADVYHPRSPRALIRLLQSLEYDILHLHVGGDITKRILGLMAACAFFGRGKSVLTIHSGGFAVSDAANNARPNSLTGFVLRRFRKIIVVNELMIEVLRRFGVNAEKIRLIPPYVHKLPDAAVIVPDYLQAFAAEHSPFLLTVGLLEDTYDLFMQIDAMAKILEKLPGAGLMIVGSGSLENDLRTAIAAKDYAARIFLTGDVEHKIVLHLIRDCDILLRTTKFDGDAISIREALFLNTPVIAADNRMRPAGVELIPVGDAESLVAAIEKIAPRRKTPTAKTEDRRNIKAVVELYQSLRQS